MLSRLSFVKYRIFEAFVMQMLLKFSLQSIVDNSNCDLSETKMNSKKLLTNILKLREKIFHIS
jgi:hypothetical protein